MKANMRLISLLLAATSAFVTGCGQVALKNENAVDKDAAAARSRLEKPLSNIQPKQPRFVVKKEPLIPVEEVDDRSSHDWLHAIKVSISARAPLPLSQIARKLSGDGINLSSMLPLDNYTFTGNVNNLDGESALRLVLGSAGLDYEVDDARHVVSVKPLASRTWYMNMGPRQARFSNSQSGTGTSNGAATNSNSMYGASSVTGGVSGSSSGTGMGNIAGTTMPTAGNTSATPSGSSSGNTSGVEVSANDNFWSSLKIELDSRLTLLVPIGSGSAGAMNGLGGLPNDPNALNQPLMGAMNPGALPAPTAGQGQGGGNQLTGNFASRRLGTYALNPETGAVTVQAPHWLLADLDPYLKRVQEGYNTAITFVGEVVSVTTDAQNSEGIDIQAFGRWVSDRYRAVLSNNALGGLTVSFTPGSNSPLSITPGQNAISNFNLGISRDDGLQIFTAYMANFGKVSVIQRPILSTTSGIPGEFQRMIPRYFTTISQQAAAGGTGSAAVATQNNLQMVELGTLLRINPRYDFKTGLIRAQIDFLQNMLNGSQTVPQSVSSGNTVTQVPTVIPIVASMRYTGEALLKDGDLIIVGGQQDDSTQSSGNGLSDTEGRPMSGLFGTRNTQKTVTTYFFALRVVTAKRS